MPDAMHFEARAEVYARARPPYPPELWARVRESGLVGPARRAVDLGAGTGEATGPLLMSGMDVVAVEPGARLAAILTGRHPRAEVIVARAEDVHLPEGSFDLAIAATSVHWMDLDIVLPKVHRALTVDGRFLVWRQVFGDTAAPVTPFRERVQEIVRRRGQSPSEPGPEDATVTAERLSRSGHFVVDDLVTWRWSVEMSARQVEELFAAFSNWSDEEVAQAGEAVRDLGGAVVEHYSSWLIELRPARGAQS